MEEQNKTEQKMALTAFYKEMGKRGFASLDDHLWVDIRDGIIIKIFREDYDTSYFMCGVLIEDEHGDPLKIVSPQFHTNTSSDEELLELIDRHLDYAIGLVNDKVKELKEAESHCDSCD